jgi:flagellar hook protein FlgE
MGLYGMMRTSASGMAAQANRLGTVADNIANSSTTGYKRASTEFTSLILDSGGSEYVSGGVETRIRHTISEQGAFKFTTSVTDLAVKGNGFFVVSGNQADQTFLTRAGSFVQDGDANLVNAAGYKLMGYSLADGNPNVVSNGTAGLAVVNLGTLALQANPSTQGTLFVNLPSDASITAPADLPSANTAASTYGGKTSLVAYDSLGDQVTIDVFAARTGSGTWEITAYDRSAAGAGGSFPYSSGPLTTETLSFGTDGQLTTSSPTSLSFTVPNGGPFTLDMSQSSQLATDYTVLSASVNGNAASEVQRVEISDDGYLYAVFENGARVPTYRIPLADVPSPDNLTPLAGNVYALGVDSGDLHVDFPRSGGFGSLVSSALEQSTVDLASELTSMIESERNYTANSKVFQTGAELMDVLVNLKR